MYGLKTPGREFGKKLSEDVLRFTKWAITTEGQMNRFLGISYTGDRERGSCKTSAAVYIERVARRFDLEDTRTHVTPMEQSLRVVRATC